MFYEKNKENERSSQPAQAQHTQAARGKSIKCHLTSSHLVHLVSLAEGDRLLEPSVLLVHVRRDAPELQQLVLFDPLRQRHLMFWENRPTAQITKITQVTHIRMPKNP